MLFDFCSQTNTLKGLNHNVINFCNRAIADLYNNGKIHTKYRKYWIKILAVDDEWGIMETDYFPEVHIVLYKKVNDRGITSLLEDKHIYMPVRPSIYNIDAQNEDRYRKQYTVWLDKMRNYIDSCDSVVIDEISKAEKQCIKPKYAIIKASRKLQGRKKEGKVYSYTYESLTEVESLQTYGRVLESKYGYNKRVYEDELHYCSGLRYPLWVSPAFQVEDVGLSRDLLESLPMGMRNVLIEITANYGVGY